MTQSGRRQYSRTPISRYSARLATSESRSWLTLARRTIRDDRRRFPSSGSRPSPAQIAGPAAICCLDCLLVQRQVNDEPWMTS